MEDYGGQTSIMAIHLLFSNLLLTQTGNQLDSCLDKSGLNECSDSLQTGSKLTLDNRPNAGEEKFQIGW